MKTVLKTFISTFLLAFILCNIIMLIDHIFYSKFEPTDVMFVGLLFWVFILIIELVMDILILDKDKLIDLKLNHFYIPPPPPITKDNIIKSGSYEKQQNKEEKIRLQLTLAYLNFSKNGLHPLEGETVIIERLYQYVKEGQKPKKPIQDEI